ncbi:MAG: hypothetical protein IJJ60_02280, partial [Clostridia bacterium]|nr:hypothetical protein [Clostridia bacterium]
FALGLSRKGFAILAAALVLLITTVALALTNWNVIVEWVYHLEKQESRVEMWTLEQKQSIADALREQDYDMSALPDLNGMTEEEKDAALTDWLKAQFDGELTSFHFNLMTRLNGFFDSWSLEDKAWYDSMLVEGGEAWEGRFISSVPPADQSLIPTIMKAAADQLRAAYDGTDMQTDACTPFLFYGYLYPDETVHYWRVHYRNENKSNMFIVQIEDGKLSPNDMEVILRVPTLKEQRDAQEKHPRQNTREIFLELRNMEAERGLIITWPYEQQWEWLDTSYGVPGPEAISQEKVYAIARQAYCDATGASQEEADRLYCYSYFVIDSDAPYFAVTIFYDVDARNATDFSIEIYQDGSIKGVYMGTNG